MLWNLNLVLQRLHGSDAANVTLCAEYVYARKMLARKREWHLRDSFGLVPIMEGKWCE